MFSEFDFSLLDDPAFKEDSVREELIVPVLKRLGYSASPPNQICRSTALEHPYVYIGSQRKKISIFPDYILKRSSENFLVLDAKAPSEVITEGRNVEQAYSYAIHKDVRTPLFALCNGHYFAVFHVSHWPAILHFPLTDIEDNWKQVAALLGVYAVQKAATFLPDLGIGMLRLGFALDNGKKIFHLFIILDIVLVARVDEDTYSLQSRLEFEGTVFMGTFDFKKELLDSFLNAIKPKDAREAISRGLRSNPFTWRKSADMFGYVGLACTVTDHVLSNKNEQYLPFAVDTFI